MKPLEEEAPLETRLQPKALTMGDVSRAQRRAAGFHHPIARTASPLPRYLRRHIEDAKPSAPNRRQRKGVARMERIIAQRGIKP